MKMSFQPSLSKSKKSTPKPTYFRLTPSPARMLASSNAAAVVAVERRHLLGEVRADDVEPAVGIVVAHADAHAGERDAILVERACRPAPRSRGTCRRGCCDTAGSARCRRRRRCRASRRCRNRPPPRPSRTSRSAASCCRRTPSTRAARPGDAGRFRDVGKRAVAAIAIEDVRAAGEAQRAARHRNLVVAAVGGLARARRLRRIEVHVVGDEQIEMPVAVVVEKAAAGAPARAGAGDASLLGDVGERAVAVVVIEHVAAPVRDEQIVEAVVVVVADAAAPGPTRSGSARPCRDVGERAVAIVVKEVAGRAVPSRACGSRLVPFTRKMSSQPSLS